MRSVLFVDDEPNVLDAARAFLERFGDMQVVTATTAREALKILVTETFDALVVDYSLPEMTGIELLKILRLKGDTTPVIIFTGVGRENAAIEALNNGADFFLKKGEGPSSEFRELVHMINCAAERRLLGSTLGFSEKVLSETVNFFSEPAYAIDREARIVAWNEGMEQVTGIPAKDILGKGGGAHAVPFLNRTGPMLTELIFEKSEVITQKGYTITDRNKTTICAWTVVRNKGMKETVLWMKAAALYDTRGAFVGALGMVRDITDDIGQDLLRQTDHPETSVAPAPSASTGKVLGKLMGKAKSSHRSGLRLSYREAKYAEALPFFDQAIEIDPAFAAAWHDRAVCLRELGKIAEALKSFLRATELAPDDEEFLYSFADMLRQAGILQGRRSHIEAAVKNFSRLVEINPNNADAWNALGICMKELGKDVTATQYFERANTLIRSDRARRKTRNFDLLV